MVRPFWASTLRRVSSQEHRGAITIFTCLLLVFMLGLIALSVDVGYMLSARTELQSAADAAALAGAAVMRDGTTAARAECAKYANENYAAGRKVTLDTSQDIEFGLWDSDTRTFTVLSPSSESQANSLRVTCRLAASRGTAAPLFFGRVWGKSSADISASATARGKYAPCGAFTGLDSAVIKSSSRTDSFDSSDGAYSASSAGNMGHVCSNGKITVAGSAIVRGDAHPGVGQSVQMGGSASVTGSTDPLTKAISAPAVDFGDSATNNDNNKIVPSSSGRNAINSQGEFSLGSNENLTLKPGTYYFTKFTMGGGSTITVTGPTTIFCSGDMSCGGASFVNTTQLAQNLQIYSTGANCDFGGGTDFYGVIYAPTAKLNYGGNADFFGMLMGKQITMSGNGGLHYDQGLGVLKGIRTPIALVQ